ncbi:MAG: prephenate dehydratase domain-containing protein [Candidatus Pacebacteria bacterium]|mgnify:CR=1 FL=1|jgi:prephenate dehydratase|nr:prephenate dehydratase [bacterium]MDP6527340.1 prephenate dehydratase domain-containing protein [Candidatus Paceibacterota bacterium]MDP6659382.1 prephenate dehydratase domain-containing protein [Candidatus Paceibacterota bacterium]|tara:strand:- start:46241 stop:46801 length:561 start_codon:yes stop_codon:yes gene_type:complete
MRIGIAGAKGSFSEEAAENYTNKAGIKDYEFDYLVTVEAVLNNLTESKVDLGIFPIENSNGGIVIEAVHAMAKYSFAIKKLFDIDVHHNLLVQHGTTASDVKKVTSHDQAIKQCRMYLKRKWPDVDVREHEDTAKAAKELGEGKLSSDTAVIAPKICAKLYDLDILEENIQDLKFNFTTFVVAKRI